MFWIVLGCIFVIIGIVIIIVGNDREDALLGVIEILIGIALILLNADSLEEPSHQANYNDNYIEKVVILDDKDTVSVTYIYKVDSTLSN